MVPIFCCDRKWLLSCLRIDVWWRDQSLDGWNEEEKEVCFQVPFVETDGIYFFFMKLFQTEIFNPVILGLLLCAWIKSSSRGSVSSCRDLGSFFTELSRWWTTNKKKSKMVAKRLLTYLCVSQVFYSHYFFLKQDMRRDKSSFFIFTPGHHSLSRWIF